MSGFMQQFVDVDFIGYLTSFTPLVGGGFLLGALAGIVGWVWGWLTRMARFE